MSAFFVFISPTYNSIGTLRTQVESYNEALGNSKALENERDKLTAKYNAINPENLMRLEKLLPENIDNIRLILEIEQIALPYGMALRDVRYSTIEDKKAPGPAVNADMVQGGGGGLPEVSYKDYGSWDLEFSTFGTYNNFINFTKDLEKNLRIVDISSIEFSSGDVGVSSVPGAASESYKYNFKIKTYWLRN